MYITTPKRKNGITVIRLVHGYRKDGKVKIKIIKTLGQSKIPEEIEHLKKMALSLKLELETKKKTKAHYDGFSQFMSHKRRYYIE